MSIHVRRFLQYLLFTFLLLALVPILGALTGYGMDFSALASRASEASGIPWTSNLFNILRLALYEPGLFLLILGSSVPTLAALLMLWLHREKGAWGNFLRTFHPFRIGSVPKALTQYAILILSVLGTLALVYWFRQWGWPERYHTASFGWGPFASGLILTLIFFDQGAILEEGGWRGYATPLLQQNGVTPLIAACWVGLAWASWHIPRDVVTGVIGKLGILPYLLLYLPSFTLGCVVVSIIAAYFMNRLGGSIIPAIIVHGITNDAIDFAGFVTIDQALTPIHQISRAVPFVFLALIIIYFSGRQLGKAERL